MANDEDALRAAIEANGGTPPKGRAPDMASWSTEAGLLADAINELRALKSVLIQVNSKPGAAPPKLEPVPIPESVWPKIAHEFRMRRHKELVARLIPSKRAEGIEPPLR